jgi:hypothetical protein
MMGVERLELSRLLRSTDFKSAASTIPPYPRMGYYLNLCFNAISYHITLLCPPILLYPQH